MPIFTNYAVKRLKEFRISRNLTSQTMSLNSANFFSMDSYWVAYRNYVTNSRAEDPVKITLQKLTVPYFPVPALLKRSKKGLSIREIALISR